MINYKNIVLNALEAKEKIDNLEVFTFKISFRQKIERDIYEEVQKRIHDLLRGNSYFGVVKGNSIYILGEIDSFEAKLVQSLEELKLKEKVEISKRGVKKLSISNEEEYLLMKILLRNKLESFIRERGFIVFKYRHMYVAIPSDDTIRKNFQNKNAKNFPLVHEIADKKVEVIEGFKFEPYLLKEGSLGLRLDPKVIPLIKFDTSEILDIKRRNLVTRDPIGRFGKFLLKNSVKFISILDSSEKDKKGLKGEWISVFDGRLKKEHILPREILYVEASSRTLKNMGIWQQVAYYGRKKGKGTRKNDCSLNRESFTRHFIKLLKPLKIKIGEKTIFLNDNLSQVNEICRRAEDVPLQHGNGSRLWPSLFETKFYSKLKPVKVPSNNIGNKGVFVRVINTDKSIERENKNNIGKNIKEFGKQICDNFDVEIDNKLVAKPETVYALIDSYIRKGYHNAFLVIFEDPIVRRRIKELCISNGYSNIQFIRSETVREKILKQDEWTTKNIVLNLFTKAGGIPWTISSDYLSEDTGYLGLSFKRKLPKERFGRGKFYLGISTLFSPSGELIDCITHSYKLSEEEKIKINREAAENMINKALIKYYSLLNTIPKRLMIAQQIYMDHKSLREEVNGIFNAIEKFEKENKEETNILSEIFLINFIRNNIFRAYDLSRKDKRIEKNTCLFFNSNELLFFFTGSRKGKEFKGFGTPQPVRLRIRRFIKERDKWNENEISDEQLKEILKIIVGLTKLRWNTNILDNLKEPLPLYASSRIAQLSKEMDIQDFEFKDVRHIL